MDIAFIKVQVNFIKEATMSLLYTIAVILFIVGLLGLIIPGIPGATFIRWAIVIAIIMFVVGLFTGRGA
jgi:uncharacterized protein YqgC (DUF456 family)